MRASDPRRSDRTGAVRGAWLPALLLIVPGVVAGLFWRSRTGRPVTADHGVERQATAWSRTTPGASGAGTLVRPAPATGPGGSREALSGAFRSGDLEWRLGPAEPDPLAVFEAGSPAALAAGDAEWLAGYRELERLGELDEKALRDLHSPVGTGRKAALLRVLYETEASSAAEGFRLAMGEPESASSPQRGTVGLATFAVHYLDRRAVLEPRARALLLDFLQQSAKGAAGLERVDLRSRAARTLGRTAAEPEFEALAETLAGEPNPDVLRAAFTGLRRNSDAVRNPAPFLALGFVAPDRLVPERTEP